MLFAILALNAAAIALIVLVMIADYLKRRRSAKQDQEK